MAQCFGVDTHKFGGSSLADSACFVRVADLLQNHQSVVVVSAIGNTTSQLQHILDCAITNQPFDLFFEELVQTLSVMMNTLLDKSQQAQLHLRLKQDEKHIVDILQTVHYAKAYDKHLQDLVLGFGELWSAQLLVAYLNARAIKAVFLDASSVLIVDDDRHDVAVDWEQSEKKLNVFLDEIDDVDVIVATGFIAGDRSGRRVTLGRNSSDYSASIFAKLFKSTSLTIWTDVDGVMSADPRQVPSAFVIEQLSYKEALELAYFGASVLHPLTIPLLAQDGITLRIKNSFEPELSGTLIDDNVSTQDYPVKGLSSIDDIALLSVEGAGMIGVSGISARVFNGLQQKNISVIFITQASSEYSICLAVKESQAQLAYQALTEAFAMELQLGHIENISIDIDSAIIAIVGDGMVGERGIAARFFSALSNARINIRAIAQGSSERNVSVIVRKNDLSRSLRAVHAAFHLSRKTISIGLIGPGNIGKTFLKQLAQEESHLLERFDAALRLRGVMNTQGMMLDQEGFPLSGEVDALKPHMVEGNIEDFLDHIRSEDIPHSVLIDMTASDRVASCYELAAKKGIHIITPNKCANSGSLASYQSLREALSANQRQYYYEATVCAGLPIIQTIRDLIDTGDKIHSIEGVFSGTLGFIFCQINKGMSFSKAVLQAYELGYTEPDPREDLSGRDVARKTVCLARELGLKVSIDDLVIESLVPEALVDVSLDVFLELLPQYNEEMMSLLAEKSKDAVGIHYVGSISEHGEVAVGIMPFSSGHNFSRLNETDNMVVIYSQHYNKQPLVIQGPGAGAEVTASGIFSDLLRLVAKL